MGVPGKWSVALVSVKQLPGKFWLPELQMEDVIHSSAVDKASEDDEVIPV